MTGLADMLSGLPAGGGGAVLSLFIFVLYSASIDVTAIKSQIPRVGDCKKNVVLQNVVDCLQRLCQNKVLL